MLPPELELTGFPPALLQHLLEGGLTEPLPLTFSSPLMAGRAKRGLYRLLRSLPSRPFRISQPGPCTLVLKPRPAAPDGCAARLRRPAAKSGGPHRQEGWPRGGPDPEGLIALLEEEEG